MPQLIKGKSVLEMESEAGNSARRPKENMVPS